MQIIHQKAILCLITAIFVAAGVLAQAQDFCDSRITVDNGYFVPTEESCCFSLSFWYTADDPNAPNVTGYSAVGVNGAYEFDDEIKGGVRTVYWLYCLPKGASRTVVLEVYGDNGTVICHREFFIECDGQNCCDALQPQAYSTNDGTYNGCKGNIEICPEWLETCTGADIRVMPGTITWLSGCTVTPFCVPMGATQTFTFEALDAHGDVLCTTTHTINCGGGPGSKSATPSELSLTEADMNDPALRVHPNPTRDRIHLSFNLAERRQVTITLFDQLGRSVAQLHNRIMDVGSYAIQRDIADTPPGIYIVSLTIGAETFSTQIVITR